MQIPFCISSPTAARLSVMTLKQRRRRDKNSDLKQDQGLEIQHTHIRELRPETFSGLLSRSSRRRPEVAPSAICGRVATDLARFEKTQSTPDMHSQRSFVVILVGAAESKSHSCCNSWQMSVFWDWLCECRFLFHLSLMAGSRTRRKQQWTDITMLSAFSLEWSVRHN